MPNEFETMAPRFKIRDNMNSTKAVSLVHEEGNL